MWFILVPLMLLGLVLAVVIPLGLALIAVVHAVGPMLLVGFVLWAIFASRGDRRHRHHLQRDLRERSMALTRPLQPQPSARPAAAPQSSLRPELPIEVQIKVEQIKRKAEMLLHYGSRFQPFSQDLYLVRETAGEYLPRTIGAFLALPENRRTGPESAALRELKEQLDLLNSKLDEIGADLERRDLDRLLANRRFLEERFGEPSAQPV